MLSFEWTTIDFELSQGIDLQRPPTPPTLNLNLRIFDE